METQTEGFGRRLRDARQAVGLTQVELADAVGSSQSAISQLESGERNPSLVTVQRLATALKVSVGDLAGEEPA